jgi:RNA polymerase sigma-70 factor (ECF subfamily)
MSDTVELPVCAPRPAAAPSGGMATNAVLCALLLRVGQADQRAFKHLYDLTAPRLLARAFAVLGTRDCAEDALQDAFVRIWRNAGQFDPSRGLAAAWLMRVIRNAAIDRLRQDRVVARYCTAGETLPDMPVDPDPVEDRLDLTRALARLSPEQASTIRRVIVLGWTHDEVAQRDGVPTATAKARAQRGLRRLHADLTNVAADTMVDPQSERAVA